MKKLIKIIILVVLVMVSGCAIQKKEENAKVIDTSMFLYKVSNQEGEYSYLFGTCHPGRYPIKSLDKVTEKALDESDSIYLECSLDQKELQKYSKYLSYYSIRQLGLEDLYEDVMKQYKSLEGKSDYVTYNAFAISSIAGSDLEVLNKVNISKYNAIDNYIYDYAQKKKNFKEVEGVEFQMKLFAKLSKSHSQEILTELKNKKEFINGSKKIIDAYYSGNTQYYEDEQNLILDYFEHMQDTEKVRNYLNVLYYNRNIHMKDTLINSINNGKHDFIGVGCKHLYGKKGIIQLLRDDGYLVECMK
ncbi:TraB/GumN family protein [Faecalibacillus intestinalis]|uniref:TraB/GumN family protein n=1 Tax=Faecalibacillus intestinalis TaxID=1982626 RepID=A0AAP2XTN9_9FIRM|nr:TraB/GumN family protein [Faecalibacillus intestinalis]MCB8593451.1 TraB/GumN family protein [Faecalibacillus intestinalis]MCB8613956.1 TraB/GumN family protein [Faecalibacillus intestinalis]MCG4682045.1 TraB/GumN family protein [Faecalibacillus intestinalis]MCG4714869.1 TraB/GumN family protein [Faecalibacillus intestinalis]MCG4756098.1 TraB/GumN family protein [Faecalibacillus intestinalis]